jgi:hypothetical protein
MSIQRKNALFALGGFLLGTLGLQALKSKPAKKLAVGVIARGIKVKSDCEGVLEEARAQFDDIVAEAGYLNEDEDVAAATPPKPRKSK